MKETYGERLKVNWKYFSLEQVNEEAGEGVNVWEEPRDYKPRGLLAFKAAEAARRQGEDAFQRLHLAMLKERHEKGRKNMNPDFIDEVAREAGLDLERLHRDMQDPTLLQALARSHTEAVEQHGVFGTPTLVFEDGTSAYLKMMPPPPEDEMVDVFEGLHRMVTARTYIREVKRPRAPKRD